jgi:hypothetical protein
MGEISFGNLDPLDNLGRMGVVGSSLAITKSVLDDLGSEGFKKIDQKAKNHAILPAKSRLLSFLNLVKAARQGCPARLPARQGCPGKAARQGCPARLPGKAARQGCPARLPGKAARHGCPARLPGTAARQGCPARLPGKAARQGCPARLHDNGAIC